MRQSTGTHRLADLIPLPKPSRRRTVLVALASLVANCLVTEPAQAFGDCARALRKLPLNVVEQAPNLVSERITGRELFGHPRSLGVRHARFIDSRSARSFVPERVHRVLPRLWRIRVTRNIVPQQLKVTLRLAGATNRLSGEDSRAQLPIRIVPLPPVVTCHNSADHIIEGGAELIIAPSVFPMAGSYQGTIDVDVRVR